MFQFDKELKEEQQLTSSESKYDKSYCNSKIGILLSKLMPQSEEVQKKLCSSFEDYLMGQNTETEKLSQDVYYWGNMSELWKHIIKEKKLQAIIASEMTILYEIGLVVVLIYLWKAARSQQKLKSYFEKQLRRYKQKEKGDYINFRVGIFMKTIFDQQTMQKLNQQKIVNMIVEEEVSCSEEDHQIFMEFISLVINRFQERVYKLQNIKEKTCILILLKYLNLGAKYSTFQKYVFNKIRITNLIFHNIFYPSGAKKLLNFLRQAPLKKLTVECEALNKFI